jgi:lipoyl(octanoyl) transferase
MSRLCKVYDLSKRLTEYEEIWRLQKFLQNQTWAEKKIGAPTVDTLVLVQHQHVYTLGRGATMDNVKFRSEDISMPLFRIERGGEVTYHGPGQLVVYPIFDLDRHKRDLHWYD